MKRVFLFKTLFSCVFILTQFCPQKNLLAVQKKNPALTVMPGKTVSQQFVISGSKTELLNFTVNTPGKIELKAEWAGSAKVLIFILYKPGYIQAIRKEGRSPLVIGYTVPAGMVSPNNIWKVSLANFSSKTSATATIGIFQEGSSKPESAVKIDQKTTIKNYQLVEKPDKDLDKMDSETEVVESKPEQDKQEMKPEIKKESHDQAAGESKLELTRKRIENLRKTSKILKRLAAKPVPDSLNREEKTEVEKYNKWLLEKCEEMSKMANEGEKELNNTSKSGDIQDFYEKFEIKFLQLQQDMQQQNRQFTLLSNIMKVRHDEGKEAIHNIR